MVKTIIVPVHEFRAPPEVLIAWKRGRSYFTLNADIFSYGIVLYELMTRKIPYGEELTTDAVVDQIITKGLRPELPPQLPEGFTMQYQNLMVACWNSNENNRPTISTILNTLKELQ